MISHPRTAIWWVRRDLRLQDNQALTHALANADQVVPVFVLDPALMRASQSAAKRRSFLWNGLRTLDENLHRRGSRLVLREGEPEEALRRLREEIGATAVFAEEDLTPYARKCDGRIAARLPLQLAPGITLRHPAAVRKANGAPYAVYMPYSRAWRARSLPDSSEVLPAPRALPTPAGLRSLTIPTETGLSFFPAGEIEARRRLAAFAAGREAPIYRYGGWRDRMDLDGTSGLSPYLRFGMLSAREAVAAAASAIEAAPTAEGRRSAEVFLGELIWREFYCAILFHFPRVARQSCRQELDTIAWEAWQSGRTGYPAVAAAMRQLRATGWMHNRARMISASFLVKDLLIDRRRGELHFRQELVDGDPAANNGGWQWTAGTGTDAAPYFRIFNPVTQGVKFDPDGVYLRRWVTELAQVPAPYIHRPWDMSEDIQREARCRIGRDYPGLIVDHRWARGRALAAYPAARKRIGATRSELRDERP